MEKVSTEDMAAYDDELIDMCVQGIIEPDFWLCERCPYYNPGVGCSLDPYAGFGMIC